MADLGISFNRLTNGNIRHIYSVRPRPAFIPAPRQHGRTSQFVPVTLEERYPPRFYDYYPAYQVGLPRAPAFDRFTAEKVRELVERLRRPIACQQKIESLELGQGRERKVVRWRSPTATSLNSPAAAEQSEATATDPTVVESDDGPTIELKVDIKVKDGNKCHDNDEHCEVERGQTLQVKKRPKGKPGERSRFKKDKRGTAAFAKLPQIYLLPQKELRRPLKAKVFVPLPPIQQKRD